jgi:hypothetical protein
MAYRLSRHAEEEMVRRQIPPEWMDGLRYGISNE